MLAITPIAKYLFLKASPGHSRTFTHSTMFGMGDPHILATRSNAFSTPNLRSSQCNWTRNHHALVRDADNCVGEHAIGCGWNYLLQPGRGLWQLHQILCASCALPAPISANR